MTMDSITPYRLWISDRFPVASFVIQVPERRWYEVACATHPALFHVHNRERRSPANFYSSRYAGLLFAEQGESTFLIPGRQLQRFAGARRIYFALSTYGDARGNGPRFTLSPKALDQTPYIQLSPDFTGRSVDRAGLCWDTGSGESRGETASYACYGGAMGSLCWGGDALLEESAPEASDPELATALWDRPADLVENFVFLGQRVEGGVSPTLRDRLTSVQNHLRSVFEGLPAEARMSNGRALDLNTWAGVRTIAGWQNRRGNHSLGAAVDINATSQPYIATRTVEGRTTYYGGEAAGAGLQAERRAAVAAMDRAMLFTGSSPAQAEIHAEPNAKVRNRTEAEARATYRRFANASSALARYLSCVFRGESALLRRRPAANIETATREQLLAAIPQSERLPEAEAMANIRRGMSAGFGMSAEDAYLRILRDYEQVRIPMVSGNPSSRPDVTRNPARGFLHMPEELVVALTRRDVGRLRWGAADFGRAESGDVHHFDLG